MMKKLIRSTALILALALIFVVPVSADDFDNASYIELLDYTTLLNGLNSLVVPTHKSVVVHVPQYEVYTYYELIYRGPSGVTLSIDNQKLTTVSIGNGLFRAYGNATTANNFTLGLDYSGTSPVSINFYSIRASNVSREHYKEIGYVQVGSSKSYMTSSSSYVTYTFPAIDDHFSYSFHANFSVDHGIWQKYDYLDFYVCTWVSDVNSITVSHNGQYVPFTKLEMLSSDSYVHSWFVVRMDLRGLDRTSLVAPVLKISGIQAADGKDYVELRSVVGYIDTNTLSPFSYWFNRINNAFATLQQRQDAMHQDQLEFYVDNLDALSTMRDNLISAIGSLNTTLASFWSEMSSRLALFQSSMENQIHGFRSSMESWFSNVSSKLDQLIGSTTEGDELSEGAADLEDQVSDIQDFEQSQQEILDNSMPEIQQSVSITSFTAALAFVQRYINATWLGIEDFTIIYTLPIFVGLFFFICGRLPGVTRWNSRPPKGGGSN